MYADLCGKAELENKQHLNDASGLVSLVVKSAVERQTKSRLVAVQGKLVTVEVCTGSIVMY